MIYVLIKDFQHITSEGVILFLKIGTKIDRKDGDEYVISQARKEFRIKSVIVENNPKPAGLCGIMLPCLEDTVLADEYEKGNFSIERNIYLSLHSGLGIDTYPIGIDESTEKILEILKLLQALSNKYSKPLSARFVLDGKARIGEKTDFKNAYLQDVVVRRL